MSKFNWDAIKITMNVLNGNFAGVRHGQRICYIKNIKGVPAAALFNGLGWPPPGTLPANPALSLNLKAFNIRLSVETWLSAPLYTS